MKNFWRKVDWTTNKVWLLALSVIMVITILGVGVAAVGDPVVQGGTYTSGHLPVIDTDNVSLIDGPGYDSTTGVIEAATGRGATYVIAASDATATEKAQADLVLTGTSDQTAINSTLATLSSTGGALIHFSTGRIHQSGMVLVPSNITIEGCGDATEFYLENNSNCPQFINTDYTNTSGGNTNITLRNIKLNGNRANNNHTPPDVSIDYNNAINFQYVSNSKVENVTIVSPAQSGIELLTSHDCQLLNNNISDVSTVADGITLKMACYRVLVQGNTVNGTDSDNSGLEAQDGSYDITFCNNTILGTWKQAIEVWSHAAHDICHDVDVNNNIIDSHQLYNDGKTIYIAGLSGNFIKTVNVNNNTIIVNDDKRPYVIYFEYAQNCSASHNTINNVSANTLSTIKFLAVNNCSDINIVGNQATNLNYVDYNGEGLYLSGITSGVTISENSFVNMGYIGIGIWSATVTDVDINHNTFDKFRTAVYAQLGAVTLSNIHITDNIFLNMQVEYLSNNFNIYHYRLDFRNNQNYIAPGEVRTATVPLAAALTGAIGASWHNPEAQDCYIKRVVVSVNSAAAAAATGKVGIADDDAGTNLGAEFFTAITLDSGGVYDSYAVGDTGAQTKYVLIQDSASATDGRINLMVETNDSTATGTMYIEYVGK